MAVTNGAFSVVVPADCVFTLTYSNTASGQTAPPLIAQQPQSQAVMTASSVLFTVTAERHRAPELPVAVQRREPRFLQARPAPAFTLAGVQSTNAGSYSVVATNAAGSATSAAAVLTV